MDGKKVIGKENVGKNKKKRAQNVHTNIFRTCMVKRIRRIHKIIHN
jgi:hypothetical protein